MREALTLPLAPRALGIVVGLMPAHVADHIVVRAVQLIAIAGDVFAILDDAVVHLRHPLVQTSHTLQLLYQK